MAGTTSTRRRDLRCESKSICSCILPYPLYYVSCVLRRCVTTHRRQKTGRHVGSCSQVSVIFYWAIVEDRSIKNQNKQAFNRSPRYHRTDSHPTIYVRALRLSVSQHRSLENCVVMARLLAIIQVFPPLSHIHTSSLFPPQLFVVIHFSPPDS